jgi:spore maturation protein CgeB
MNIVFSFNKTGEESAFWKREIAAASIGELVFHPFNHGEILDPSLYATALSLDRLYQARDPRLGRLYDSFEDCLKRSDADAVIVANAPPYHPDYLRRISAYKVLYSADDPGATYLINIPYLHAYDHVFFVAPTYSADMDMKEKMTYAGKINADWLPISVFDFERDAERTEEKVFERERDIDIIYIGGFWRQKLPLLASVKRAFGRRFRLHGFFGVRHNIFMNARYGLGKWVSPVGFGARVALYQRAKIGFNIHWNEYGLGNQRLYHLPANGVMQISDCADHLHRVFEPGREIIGYHRASDLIEKLKYFLEHESEREAIARQGYRRTMRDYRFELVARQAGLLIRQGMERIGWKRSAR